MRSQQRDMLSVNNISENRDRDYDYQRLFQLDFQQSFISIEFQNFLNQFQNYFNQFQNRVYQNRQQQQQ